ncbi:hypothetical protein [Sedimentisphaera salicampi]|uniref:hypothetical protein n=1 Tax=Sedimentisphaera salicampi TaxID=1941349 RepID=UPI000B9B9196|nr:hypothetical protein [Sedimentisphaera salicampi]OXU15647.1 Intracellular exo-alpha-(1->5)-L-arabinofuranosidase 1 [Sedimentisphaera salicampi]
MAIVRFLTFLTVISFAANSAFAENISLKISPESRQGKISEELMGFNAIYCWNPKDFWYYENNIELFKELNTEVLRYPGGEVSDYFHWKLPTYDGWHDAWKNNPDLDPKLAPENDNYITVDDYIELCEKIGCEKMIGVNIDSGLVFNRNADSLREAMEFVRYCKENDYGVKYWYVGNEPYHEGSRISVSAEQYARIVKNFASRMKRIDPDIQIIVNWKSGVFKNNNWNQIRKIIEHAGEFVDVLDVHWYWNWGKASWKSWLSQKPMSQKNQWHPKAPSYEKTIEIFRSRAESFGRDIKFASLEWNVGPKDEGEDLTARQCSLMQAEMMMQFINGGLDIACMWPIDTPNRPNAKFSGRNLFEGKDNPQPVYYIFRLLSNVMGKTLIESEPEDFTLPSAAAMDESSGKIYVFALNKSELERELSIEVAGAGDLKVSGKQAAPLETDSEKIISPLKTSITKEGINAVMKPYSFAMFEIGR